MFLRTAGGRRIISAPVIGKMFCRKFPQAMNGFSFSENPLPTAAACVRKKAGRTRLEQSLTDAEVLNFGVNGFSTTQSYLHYNELASRLDFNAVIFAFVPADMEREINVSPCLRQWTGCRPNPRFILADNRLTLIPGLYKDRRAYFAENKMGFSPRLRKHLMDYDRYYFPAKFEITPVIGKSVLYKIFVSLFVQWKEGDINRRLMEPDSEAFRITRRLFQQIDRQTKERNKKFILIFLPWIAEVKAYQTRTAYRMQWDAMVAQMCAGAMSCLDVMKEFQKIPLTEFDTSYDGSHYGPRTNRRIAEYVKGFLPTE